MPKGNRKSVVFPKSKYLFKDNFEGSSVNLHKWTVTDTESKISLDGAGRLVCSGGKATPAGGDPGLVSKISFPRTQGLTCEFELKPTANNLYCAAGFSDGSIPDTLNDIAFGYFGNTGYVRATNINNILLPFAYSAGVSYYWRIVVLPVGYLFYISTDRYTWYMVWKYEAGITATLYAAYGGYNNPFTSDFMRVYAGTAKTPIIDALAAAPTLAYGSELLTNGNMETNGTWVLSILTPTTTQQSNEQANGGTYSWKTVTDATGEGTGYNPALAGVSGAWYLATGYLYVSAGDCRFKDNNGIIAGNNTVTTTGAWTACAFTNRATSTGNIRMCSASAASAVSTFYMDDYSLKIITLSSTLSGGGDVGTQYGVYDADVTVAANYQAGIMACLDSASSPLNFLHAYLDRSNSKVYLTKTQTTTTDLTSGTVTYAAGAKLRLVVAPGSSGLSNAQVGVYYNSVIVGTVQTVDLSSGYGTLFRAFDTSAAATLDLEVNI